MREAIIAQYLADHKIVGLVIGRAEYGPRALCHRSILVEAINPTITKILNEKLERSDFMPFAPVILEEFAPQYFKEYPKGAYAAQFMTVCYNTTELCKQKAPAIVHVDGTVRPQIVNKENNPFIYEVLTHYYKLTGLPICINTSFNRHEEPIVNTIEDAEKELRAGRIEVLIR
jgi:carbamoyltransferase